MNNPGETSSDAAGGISVIAQIHRVKHGGREVVMAGIDPEGGLERVDDMTGGADLVLIAGEESVRVQGIKAVPLRGCEGIGEGLQP